MAVGRPVERSLEDQVARRRGMVADPGEGGNNLIEIGRGTAEVRVEARILAAYWLSDLMCCLKMVVPGLVWRPGRWRYPYCRNT